MLITDNQLIGKQPYSNGSSVIMKKRTEQAEVSAESVVSEKQAFQSNVNDIAVIYEKSNSNNIEIVTYAKPSTVKATAVSKSTIKDVQKKIEFDWIFLWYSRWNCRKEYESSR